MADPKDILAYWLDDLGPEGWYSANPNLDRDIRDQFQSAWQDVKAGACGLWLTYATGTLAYIILTDQFTRNMFRDTATAFSTDRNARAAAKAAISKGWDMRVEMPARQFFYMPLMHSENLCDQDRCVRLMLTRLQPGGEGSLLHAKTHRKIIRQFGRFPFRNAALGRATTEAEAAFIKNGGYKQMFDSMQAKAAA